ncbi:MAG: tyrosine-type recombinase/integrase [Chloroflexi bacterium]|nr:tyrosine-type recombinase/integrase [Chloroflexota bacterium]
MGVSTPRRRRGKLVVAPHPVAAEAEVTWEEAKARFLLAQEAMGRRRRTVELHRESLKSCERALRAVEAPESLRAIRREDLERAIAWLLARLHPRTVNIRIQTLRMFFSFLWERGVISENPAAGIAKVKVPKRIPKTLSDEEVARLLEQPDLTTFVGERDYVMMLVFLDTGMRMGEILNLKLNDIDFSRRRIVIREAKDAEEREVPISERTAQALKRYLLDRADSPCEEVFISREDTPLNSCTLQDRLRLYGAKAGCRVPVSPHVLRHTFARMYIMNGGDPFSLRRILGHSTFEMVSVYVNLFAGDIQKQHERFSPVNRLALLEACSQPFPRGAQRPR